MLSYDISRKGNIPMYEYLYRCIKEDIVNGRLVQNEKLPSKRKFAENMSVSVITVENAYAQLLCEGYIYSVEKSGYYVAKIEQVKATNKEEEIYSYPAKKEYSVNMKSNTEKDGRFPVQLWCRITRKVLTEKSDELFRPCGFAGCEELRNEIAAYLHKSRSINVSPDCIIIGAGTEYLCNLLVQLLGSYKVFGIENPGYRKVADLYKADGARCFYINLDNSGLCMQELKKSPVEVLHISPNHHYPTGRVTTASRRFELLAWANERDGRYIIEDDYDSEFRFDSSPCSSMRAEDKNGKVIYMNTFSKTVSPSLRVGYLVLPKKLMNLYLEKFENFSCTVSASEQYILSEFIGGGYYERHIGRMKKFYKARREAFFSLIQSSSVADKIEVKEEHSGLHFLLKIDTEIPDKQLLFCAEEQGILLAFLSEFSVYFMPEYNHQLVVNYGSMNESDFEKVLGFLSSVLK